ncbi:MAG: hypothetical protein K0S80_4909 [Neobacillus sp.]|nr:hypothetical protein [Neobacillus sp.]
MKSYENTLQKYNVSVSGDLKVMKQNKLIELIPKNSRSFAAKHLGTTRPHLVKDVGLIYDCWEDSLQFSGRFEDQGSSSSKASSFWTSRLGNLSNK